MPPIWRNGGPTFSLSQRESVAWETFKNPATSLAHHSVATLPLPSSILGWMFIVETRVELILSRLPSGNIGGHERFGVCRAACEHDIIDRGSGVLAGPGGLPSGAITIQACSGSGNPVAEPVPCVGEVAVPPERCGAVLVGVVGAESMQVQCR